MIIVLLLPNARPRKSFYVNFCLVKKFLKKFQTKVFASKSPCKSSKLSILQVKGIVNVPIKFEGNSFIFLEVIAEFKKIRKVLLRDIFVDVQPQIHNLLNLCRYCVNRSTVVKQIKQNRLLLCYSVPQDVFYRIEVMQRSIPRRSAPDLL